ncbi:hypothetical protein KUCAC02_009431 [Chaenocephalus aceratus]|uniref:Uncharacterized protein n=1 Tax=Chaenocephalus aceratus TaxID=36190 RepID=A0ACB9WTI6_CHAAC|nr:hypothetical protein KUCAC02_009431 [Chaenocephalus aceratus]
MAWWQPARQPIKTPVAGQAANETSALCGSQAVRPEPVTPQEPPQKKKPFSSSSVGRSKRLAHKKAVTQTDRVGWGGGKVKMERSLAPDQDRRHIVPSSSRTKRCHAELCGISLPENTGPKRYREGARLRGESR